MQPISTRHLLGLILFLFANAKYFSQSAVLSSPTHSSNHFQFILEGDPYRHYVIQGSSNLQHWIPLTTNVSPMAKRPLSFAASNDFGFYRSAPYTRTNLVSKAIQTTGSLDLNGNGFVVDSFDSRDPFLSTDGRYDSAKGSDNGYLSLDQGIFDSLDIGDAYIFGSVSIGPDAPFMIGENGVVGDFAWTTSSNLGVQCGKLSTDLNPYFPEVNVPFTGGYSIPTGRVVTEEFITYNDSSHTTTNYPSNPIGTVSTNTDLVVSTNAPDLSTVYGRVRTNYPIALGPDCAENSIYHETNYVFRRIVSYTETMTTAMTNVYYKTYDYVLDEGDYRVSNLYGEVLVTGNVRFRVGTLSADKITIKTNASLELYVDGGTSLSGVKIENEGGATNFIYYGMSGSTNVAINANGGFTGIIYAPKARVVFNGGGSDICDVIGAVVAHSVKLNGRFQFHYDEALRELHFPR